MSIEICQEVLPLIRLCPSEGDQYCVGVMRDNHLRVMQAALGTGVTLDMVHAGGLELAFDKIPANLFLALIWRVLLRLFLCRFALLSGVL